jgi:protein dithiol:quinone oxidoreductase
LIDTRRARRLANGAGVAAIVGLMAYALYAQHILGLEACPLCIFQRVALITVGVILAVAGLHAPRGAGARVYAVLGALAALTGAGISSWHVHLQNLPPDAVPACGPGFSYIFSGTFPLRDALAMVFTGSGECAEVNWAFLGLSMPAWVLLWFVGLGTLAVVANWRRLAR